MEKLTEVSSRAVPLAIEDVDTDQVIPARFLKATDKRGFGNHLFYDWRFDETGKSRDDFPLNDKRYQGSILLAGRNFGCGSSREHAAWALKAYGFKVVVSSFFADIFKGNALQNGLLPVQIPQNALNELLEFVKNTPETVISIDVESQFLTFEIKGELRQYAFELDAYHKKCLLNGYDDIDYLRSLIKEISMFEESRGSV